MINLSSCNIVLKVIIIEHTIYLEGLCVDTVSCQHCLHFACLYEDSSHHLSVSRVVYFVLLLNYVENKVN